MQFAKCRLPALAALICGCSFGGTEAFTFEVASPVAAQDFRFKTALFVFRTIGCPDPAKAEVSAAGEGLVNGARQSMPLVVKAASKPGVYAVLRQWDAGRWVVVLKGSCGEAHAGAIVAVGRSGFVRDATRIYTHPPTATEVDAALKSIPEGGYK